MRHLLLLLVTAFFVVGCSVLGPPSRVREGYLYTTGDAQYDDYFKAVHDLQIEAAGWAEEKQLARKPLVDHLNLTADASDSTLIELSRQHVVKLQSSLGATKLHIKDDEVHFYTASGMKEENETPWLVDAVESCARGEVARARKLEAIPAKVDSLLATGHELEKQAQYAFAKVGAHKVNEVRQEIAVTFEVLERIGAAARHEARGVSHFIAGLQRAVSIGKLDVPPPPPPEPPPSAVASASASPPTPPPESTPPPAESNEAASEKPAPKPKPKPASKPAHKPQPAAHVAPSRPPASPKPQPQSKPSGEVFNP